MTWTFVGAAPALALSLILLAPIFVQAQAQPAPHDDYVNPDRPGIADGSNVVGAGRFQIETRIQGEIRQSGGA